MVSGRMEWMQSSMFVVEWTQMLNHMLLETQKRSYCHKKRKRRRRNTSTATNPAPIFHSLCCFSGWPDWYRGQQSAKATIQTLSRKMEKTLLSHLWNSQIAHQYCLRQSFPPVPTRISYTFSYNE
jgi:NADPH-dependent 7-cyano-7-deazaguanine reductase QueF